MLGCDRFRSIACPERAYESKAEWTQVGTTLTIDLGMPIRTRIGKTDCDADAPVQFKFDARKRFGFSVSGNEKGEKVTARQKTFCRQTVMHPVSHPCCENMVALNQTNQTYSSCIQDLLVTAAKMVKWP